ncbi:MAG: DUF4389 domain-containing protein [Gammaproteobacteria bacterium]|nr:DUF4389 domain-containing protein [Gammaproteobacteria bacterium]
MNTDELKRNLASSNQWLRLLFMVLFALLLEVAGVVILIVVVLQFLFAILTGNANGNLRRFGDQLSSYIYQILQFLSYNTEEKPFPFAEWPESESDDFSSYANAKEVDGEIVTSEEDDEQETTGPEDKPKPE